MGTVDVGFSKVTNFFFLIFISLLIDMNDEWLDLP